jgi:hypothetical protein
MTFWRALDAASAKRTISGKGGFLIPRRKGEKRDALDTWDRQLSAHFSCADCFGRSGITQILLSARMCPFESGLGHHSKTRDDKETDEARKTCRFHAHPLGSASVATQATDVAPCAMAPPPGALVAPRTAAVKAGLLHEIRPRDRQCGYLQRMRSERHKK